MSLGITLALMIAAPAHAQSTGQPSEAECIPNALMAQVQAKQPLEIDGPTATCKARYGWTAEETTAALAVANATGTVMGDAHRLLAAGVDLDLIDQVMNAMSEADVAALGTYDQESDAERLAAENNARTVIANLVSTRVEGDAQITLQMAVADRCVARNTIRAFVALRARRH